MVSAITTGSAYIHTLIPSLGDRILQGDRAILHEKITTILTAEEIPLEHKTIFLDNLYLSMERLHRLDDLYLFFLKQNAPLEKLITTCASAQLIATFDTLKRHTQDLLDSSLSRGTLEKGIGYIEKKFFLQLFIEKLDHPNAALIAPYFDSCDWRPIKEIPTDSVLTLMLQTSKYLGDGTLERKSRFYLWTFTAFVHAPILSLEEAYLSDFLPPLNHQDISDLPYTITSLISAHLLRYRPKQLLSYFDECYRSTTLDALPNSIHYLYQKLVPESESEQKPWITYLFSEIHLSELTLAIYMSLEEKQKPPIWALLSEQTKLKWFFLPSEGAFHPYFRLAFQLENALKSPIDHLLIFNTIKKILCLKERITTKTTRLLTQTAFIFKKPGVLKELADFLPKNLLPFFFCYFHTSMGSFSAGDFWIKEGEKWIETATDMLIEFRQDSPTPSAKNRETIRALYSIASKTETLIPIFLVFAEKTTQKDHATSIRFIETMEYFLESIPFSYEKKINFLKTIGEGISSGIISFGVDLITAFSLAGRLHQYKENSLINFLNGCFPEKSPKTALLAKALNEQLGVVRFPELLCREGMRLEMMHALHTHDPEYAKDQLIEWILSLVVQDKDPKEKLKYLLYLTNQFDQLRCPIEELMRDPRLLPHHETIKSWISIEALNEFDPSSTSVLILRIFKKEDFLADSIALLNNLCDQQQSYGIPLRICMIFHALEEKIQQTILETPAIRKKLLSALPTYLNKIDSLFPRYTTLIQKLFSSHNDWIDPYANWINSQLSDQFHYIIKFTFSCVPEDKKEQIKALIAAQHPGIDMLTFS